MIKEWIESYEPNNIQDTEQALREIMQEIALAGLYRANFFKHAAFYGGTALRIFHGLNRFSEDLDFSLLQKNTDFEFDGYFKSILDEFDALGLKVSLNQKLKSTISNIDSAFLKSETLWSELIFDGTIPQIKLSNKPSIKIKLEIDTNPPLRFGTENKLLTKPFSFYVNCLTLPDLFAGKMHALLFRKWKTRVKGRDWYDMEWYIKKGIKLNLSHFCQRALESGDWAQESMTKSQLMELLSLKISTVNINMVKQDVIRFIPNPQDLDIWSREYFQQISERLDVC
ncbi:nucleotidyl transferase AbiEii/AbiGii toxin family protein [Aquirufa sp. HETE-83D]|uniref:Nucleotidyl transferase AbiEii/AbiGii toxin family protein n=1 Tax=Aquirufa esocilacus TaxID=3096513 RepID=A0ABW6DIX8_9BACT